MTKRRIVAATRLQLTEEPAADVDHYAMTFRFFISAHNVVFTSGLGTGKKRLASAIGIEAVQRHGMLGSNDSRVSNASLTMLCLKPLNEPRRGRLMPILVVA